MINPTDSTNNMVILVYLIFFCIFIAALLKSISDKMFIEFINLPFGKQQVVRDKWFCFNPLNKYKLGKYGLGYKTWTIPILNIKTSFLITNLSDGWHFINSLSICIMLVPYALLFSIAIDHHNHLIWFVGIYIFFGILYNFIFNMFYNRK